MLQEWHHFFQNTLRWRNLRKITIAQVHGPVYAAGLMLAWACDLIVAAEDTVFADVVGTRLGMCGVEYVSPTRGSWAPAAPRKLLLTGDSPDCCGGLSARHGEQALPGGRTHRADRALRPAHRQETPR